MVFKRISCCSIGKKKTEINKYEANGSTLGIGDESVIERNNPEIYSQSSLCKSKNIISFFLLLYIQLAPSFQTTSPGLYLSSRIQVGISWFPSSFLFSTANI